MNSFLLKLNAPLTSTLIASFSLQTSCEVSKYGSKAKEMVIQSSSYVGEKSKSAYQVSKEKLGMTESKTPKPKPMSVAKTKFGEMTDGSIVSKYTLSNANGMRVGILDYGGTVKEIFAPDRNGKFANVSLGFDNLRDYLEKSPYFGCITGRYANRIAMGQFVLDDNKYKLATNNGPNHLHGGDRGFDKYVWRARVLNIGTGVEFTRTSPDGEEGYPGNLKCKVRYILTDENELVVEYEAQTDKATVINLTNHTYFNLAGEGSETILEHELLLPGDHYVATDNTNIPTKIAAVQGTPMDFRSFTKIGKRIESSDEQIEFGKGYDHTWLVSENKNEDGLHHAATLRDPSTGRILEIHTDQPGIQFYSGNYLDGSITGHGGKSYPLRSGLCLETQVFPDSPNHQGEDGWKSCVLHPGDVYTHKTVHRFYAE